jgi:RNA polymerase sigma-70 factor, ECF subfamily
MPDTDADWDRLVAGVRDGEPEALREFYGRYGPSLERVAARAIAPAMRRRIGPESVANSVCRTFMRRARGEPLGVPDSAGLWRLLCAIALNKVRERVRYHRRIRRSVEREADDAVGADGRTGSAPPPDEAVVFQDQLEHVMASLDDVDRRVLELRLAGLTEEQVAGEIRRSERTVRRILARLEVRLVQAFAG